MALSAKKLSIPLIVLLLGLGTWLVISQDRSRTAPTEGQLEFRNARAVSAPEGANNEQTFKFEAAWDGTTYPGARECTLSAVDQEGNVVGRYTDAFYTMMPVSPISLAIPVRSAAVDLRGECGPRLDVGGTYAYRFSDVQAGQSGGEVNDSGIVAITYDAEWLGAAKPGVVTCEVNVTDRSGATVISQRMNVLIASGHTDNHELHLADPTFETSAPGGASIDNCAPYSFRGE